MYLFLSVLVSVAMRAASGGYSVVVVHGLLWFQSLGSKVCGLPQLCHTGLVAPQHVESFRIRD